jgi:glucose-6-phosphate-specific signal transduction histidine kinase
MRYGLIDAATIKSLRELNTELQRSLAGVRVLITATRNENARLRREIARLQRHEGKRPPRT